MIVGCISCYREGPLVHNAAHSLLKACRNVFILEGRVGRSLAQEPGEPTELRPLLGQRCRVEMQGDGWITEAAKRNAALDHIRRLWPKAEWLVVLDGDEVLLHGEMLPDLIWAAEQHAAASEEQVGSLPLLVTEADGSVGKIHRVFNLRLLRRHVLSMSQFEFEGSSAVVTLPNLPVWRPGEPETETNRRPLAGEPHIHHRAYYRPPRRMENRLHRVEMDDFKRLEQEHLAAIGAPALWTPGGGDNA